MLLSGASRTRVSIVLCCLLAFFLVVAAGTDLSNLVAGPQAAYAGDPEGGEGPPEGGGAPQEEPTPTKEIKDVDPGDDRDTLVEQLFNEVIDVLSNLWR